MRCVHREDVSAFAQNTKCFFWLCASEFSAIPFCSCSFHFKLSYVRLARLLGNLLVLPYICVALHLRLWISIIRCSKALSQIQEYFVAYAKSRCKDHEEEREKSKQKYATQIICSSAMNRVVFCARENASRKTRGDCECLPFHNRFIVSYLFFASTASGDANR